MVEHTELFWSLFTVDLDAALDVQPPDTWDSFSLFQLLNDYFNKERKCQLLTKEVNFSCPAAASFRTPPEKNWPVVTKPGLKSYFNFSLSIST